MADQSSAFGRIELSSQRPLKIGSATIDCISREATFSGGTERLQPQNLKVLIALAEAKGRVVTRAELIDRCWDGRVIGDDVINRAISNLRQFAAKAGEFEIETVPRSGYRLSEQSGRSGRRGRIVTAIALACGIGASVAIHGLGNHASTNRTMLTVEVLPFETTASDSQDRAIAFAAHDSVSNALSDTRFSVIKNDPKAGRQPSADFIVTGDISSNPEGATVTLQMEQAAHHVIVYSDRLSVPRDKVWTVPQMIGPQVAGSLGWIVPLLLADHRYPSNPEILATLLQDSGQDDWLGQYERTRRVAASAQNSAVAQFALALSTGFYLRELPREERAEAAAIGRNAAARAEILGPQLGDTHIPWCLLHSRTYMAECEVRLRAAMGRDPDSPWVDYFLANLLNDGGRADEALILARHSLTADQFVPYKIALVLRLLEAKGQSQEAEQLYRNARQWWPGQSTIIWDRVYGIMDRGDFKALAQFRNELGSDGISPDLKTALEPIPSIARAAQDGDAATTRRICPLVQPPSFKRDLCLLAFTHVGDLDDAFAIALQVFPDRIGKSAPDEDRIWLDDPYPTDTDILTGSGAAPLRRDPRFLALVHRLGMVDYWKSGRLPDFCGPPHPEAMCKALGS